jgi:phage shock protein C
MMQQPNLGESPPPRRLARSTRDRMWAGVCGGLAEYFDVDPTLMRIVWVAFTIFTHGLGVPAYIVLWLVMPRDDRVERPPPTTAPVGGEAETTPPAAGTPTSWDPAPTGDWHQWGEHQPAFTRRQRSTGVILVGLGVLLLVNNLGWFSWINIDWGLAWPLILVGIGVALLAGQGRYWHR